MSPERIELIIDTDAGIDDAQAILLALGQPNVEVAAITALSGNVHVDKVVRNVLAILEATGKKVPVYRGAEHPLLGPAIHAEDYHGSDGLGDAGIPNPQGSAESDHAVFALVKMAAEHPGRYTLVTLGPLTNIALAVRIDPAFLDNVANLVIMGGTYAYRGNMNIVAEFNVFADPEAAAVVFSTGKRATLVSWELSVDHEIPFDEYHDLARLPVPTPQLDFFNRVSDYMVRKMQNTDHRGVPMPDPIAAAVAIDPSLITRSADGEIHVEVTGARTRGQTVINWKGEPRIKVITEIDTARFWQMMKASLGV
jgi:purine nucleosidase